MVESIRVLHIDDDSEFADQTATRLQDKNDRFDVAVTTDAGTGLERLDDDEFDCVVSDYDLPAMTGLDFLRHVRDISPDLPFILFTSKGSEEVASEAISAGVTDYLNKDRQVEQYAILANRIRNAVTAYRSEAAAERRLHRLRQLVKTVPAAILRIDTGGDVLFASDHAQSRLGIETGDSVETIYADSEWDAREMHSEQLTDAENPVRQILASGEPVTEFRHSMSTPDDTRHIVELNGTPLFVDGEIESVVVSLTDITAQQRRQESVEALHDIATTIQRAETVEAVCEQTVTAAADILDFDTCTVLIREGEWLVPYAVSKQTPPDGTREMRIDEGLAGKTYQEQRPEAVKNVTEDDDTKPAKDVYKSGMSVPVGEFGVFQAASTAVGHFDEDDIEYAELLLSHAESRIEQIERTKDLKRQNERLEEFAGIVSHDLTNPLNVAQLQLTLARDSVDNEHLEAVARAHGRMETLIEALLSLARTGETIEDPEPLSLTAVADDCWETLDNTDAELVTETDVVIRADEDLCGALLKNLIQNSLKHGRDGTDSTVTVRLGQLDDGFVVEDDGPGIPEEDRDNVFDSGVSTDTDGTGYGLKIVTEIVDAHDWRITATESDAGGARFEITGVDVVE
jgi:PAS domain S-box-containing protein